MKRITVVAATALVAAGAFLGTAGVGSAAGQKQAALTPAQAALGLAAWKKAGCAQCHTLAAGGGQGTRGPNLDGLWFPVSDMMRQITNGGGYMPAFGTILTKAQITALANWVDAKRLAKNPSGATTASTTTTKAATTTNPAPPVLTAAKKAEAIAAWKKAGCAQCHTLAARGALGTRGPNLDGLYFPIPDMVRQITNGGAYMPAFGTILTKTQIQSLANYVAAVRQIKK